MDFSFHFPIKSIDTWAKGEGEGLNLDHLKWAPFVILDFEQQAQKSIAFAL